MPTPRGVELSVGQRGQLVKARGRLSQAELARRVGISSQALNQIERGKKDPSFATLRRLADELHLRLELKLSARRGAVVPGTGTKRFRRQR